MLAYVIAVIRRLSVSLAWYVLQCHGLILGPAAGADGWIVVHTPPISGWRQLAKLLMVRAWVRNGYNAYGNYLRLLEARARKLAIMRGEIVDDDPAPQARATPKPRARPSRPRQVRS